LEVAQASQATMQEPVQAYRLQPINLVWRIKIRYWFKPILKRCKRYQNNSFSLIEESIPNINHGENI